MRFPLSSLISFAAVITSAAVVLVFVNAQSLIEPAVLGLLTASSATVVGLLIVRLSVGPIKALSPIAMVSYCQLLIFVARPAYAMTYQESTNIFSHNEYDASMLTAQLYAGLGFVALCVGYSIRGAKRSEFPNKRPVAFSEPQWRRLATPLYAVIAVGYGLYALYIAQIGWSGYWAATLSGRSVELREALSSSSGYLYSGLQFATGALILAIYQHALRGNTLKTAVLLLLLAASTFPQIAAGSRSVFIPVAVAMLYILHTLKPSILRFSRVILWAPIAFLLGFVAPRIWRDNLAIGGSLWDSLQIAMAPENLFDNFFGGLDTAMVDAFAIQISAQDAGDLPYQLGSTYSSLLTSVVPRSFWPDKPVSVDEVLNASLFPETNAKKIGFAFGFYSEPTLNFGLFGVLIVSAALGWALSRLAQRAAFRNDIMSSFVLLLTTSYVFPIMRGSLSFDSQRLLISLLPVVLIFVVMRPGRELNPGEPDRSQRGAYIVARRPELKAR